MLLPRNPQGCWAMGRTRGAAEDGTQALRTSRALGHRQSPPSCNEGRWGCALVAVEGGAGDRTPFTLASALPPTSALRRPPVRLQAASSARPLQIAWPRSCL